MQFPDNTKDTLRPILHRTMWSLQCAFFARRPQHGPCGTVEGLPKAHRRLTDKLVRRFATTEYKGDWEWHVSLWDLQCNWKRNQLCHLCRAARRSTHGTCFSLFGHSFEPRSPAECVIIAMPSNPSPLILTPGWHHHMIRYCSMHVCNLGLFQSLVAEGLLWACYNGGFEGDNLDAQLKAAYVSFKAWMTRTGAYCSGRLFTAKRLHVSSIDYAWLNYKAFNCRVALAWLAATLCNWRMQRKLRERLAGEDVMLNDIITTCVRLGSHCTLKPIGTS